MHTPLLIVSLIASASTLSAAPNVRASAPINATMKSESQDTGSPDSRIAELKGKISESPNDPDLHFELSKLYEEDIAQYYDEALAEFKIAVDRGLKGKVVIWNNLGDVNAHAGAIALQAGNYDKAIRNFEAAAVFNPNHYVMYNNIGFAYWQKKEFSRAIEHQRKAIDLGPIITESYETIGMIYLENRDFRLGILNMNRAMYLDDSSEKKALLFDVAQAYHGLGQYNDALDALDKLPRKLEKNEMVKSLHKECKRLLKQSRRE